MRVTYVVGAAGFLILSASPGISAPTARRLSSITHDHHIVILAKRWPDLEWLLKPFRILTSNTRPEFSIGRIDESVAETEERLIDKRFEPSRKPPDKSSPAPNPQPMILAGDITPIKEPSTALFNHDAAAHSEQDVVRRVEAHDQEAQFARTTTKNAVASSEGSGLARPGGKKAGETDALGEGNNAKAPKVGDAVPAHNAYSTAAGTMGQSVDAVRHTQPYESNHMATPNVKAESSDITPPQPKIGPLNARIVDPGPVPQLGGPPKAANSRRPQGRKPAPSQPDNHLVFEETPLATGEAEASSKTDAPAPNTFMRNHEAVDVQDQVASSDIGAGRSNSFDGDIAPDTSTNTRPLNVNAARTVVKTEANHKPVAIAIGTGAVVGGLVGGGVGLAESAWRSRPGGRRAPQTGAVPQTRRRSDLA
ncbi:hypothetical protein FRB98_003690, partial [Tulasnella sp. 332]